MKFIRKRADGRWEARKTIEGKTYSIYANTQKECKEKLKNFKPKPKKTIKIGAIPPLNEFALKWLNTYKQKDISKSTYKMYENILKNHINNLTKPIVFYSTENLQLFLNNLNETRTKEIALLTLKQIFKKAKELKVIKENPTEYLVKGKINKKTITSHSIHEQMVILENLHNYPIGKYVLAYLLTGARLSELQTIKKENIKNGYLYIDGTKRKSSKRWVKISTTYQNMLLQMEEPLFPYTSKTITKKYKDFLADINIESHIHKLRHTFNTNLYYLGATDMERKEFMGHASITITNEIYTHLDPTITKNDIINLYKDLYPKF